MKNKITKLFLAVFALFFGKMNAQEGGQPMPDYVRKATNVEFLNNFAKEKSAEYEKNYAKAVEIARKQGKPISGDNEKGSFALFGVDEETGELIYQTTYGVSNTTYFNNSATKSSLRTANAKPLHANGIKGAGMIVGVWDGGAGLSNHLAFTGGRYILKNSPNTNANAGGKAHAAHVAGTVAGGNFGSGVAMGFAHEAVVHAYNGINAYDITAMTAATTATVDPVYVSNHSYGLDYLGSGASSSIFGQYNSRAKDYDVLANNAPYYTIVFAAGNDRNDAAIPKKSGGKDLLSQAGVSKNLVVVAATRGTEDFSGITGLTSVSAVGGAAPFIASYSNYGPTDDFRIKPDIAAKGGEGIAGEQVISVGNANPTAEAAMQGTSMAAPAVTGVFTLWQGYHKTVFSNKIMKSASVRALMAHTAREAGPALGPDFMFGWGLIDAAKGVEIMDQAVAKTALFKEFELPQNTFFEYEFTYDGVNPLVATIAWNDPAGTVTSQADLNLKKIVNDLDLRLINVDTNKTYFPWSLNQQWSISPIANNISLRDVDNARDNIEKIEPENAPAGNYKIIVNHKGTLQGGKQDYSLIISGAGGQMPDTDGSVSVEDIALNNLNVYPNPVEDQLNISGDLEVLSGAEAQVFDISGKKVKVVDLNLNNAQIGVSELKAGTYILTISKNGAKKSYKFVKK